MRKKKLTIDTHGFFYTLKFGALIAVILISTIYSAGQIEKILAPDTPPEITSAAAQVADNFYLKVSKERPLFLAKREILKKKEALIWEGRDFIFADMEERTLAFYGNGALGRAFPITATPKEESFFEVPGGFYSVQSKAKRHLSLIENAYFPWNLSLFGNYLIHGPPRRLNGQNFPDNFTGGSIRLSESDAQELFSLATEDMPVLVYGNAPTPAAEFAYFRKTNLPHRVPEVSAAAALAADPETGEILFEKNKTAAFPTASITKLMTAIITIEHLSTTTSISITQEALDTYGNSAGFSEGEIFSVEDMLRALILPSSNDAAKAIELAVPDFTPRLLSANKINAAGAQPTKGAGFIALMNTKAKTLGLGATRYTDSSGLSEGNITSASDLLKLLSFIKTAYPQLLEISALKEYRTAAQNKKIPHVWRNINWPLPDERFLGGKAGFTDDSLQTMAGIYKIRVMESGARPVAIIVLGSRNRVQDIKAIIKYLEQDFVYGSILTRDKNKSRPLSTEEFQNPPAQDTSKGRGKPPSGAAVFEAVDK